MPHIEAAVGQQPVDLLDRVFDVEPSCGGQRTPDRVHSERRTVQDSNNPVGQRQHAKCMHVVANDLLDERLDVLGGNVSAGDRSTGR